MKNKTYDLDILRAELIAAQAKLYGSLPRNKIDTNLLRALDCFGPVHVEFGVAMAACQNADLRSDVCADAALRSVANMLYNVLVLYDEKDQEQVMSVFSDYLNSSVEEGTMRSAVNFSDSEVPLS